MWENILKVDRFTTEGGFKGLYEPHKDRVSINLDNFNTVAEGYDDMEKVVEFANVVTHELSHREYAKELEEEMQKIQNELFSLVKNYTKGESTEPIKKIFKRYLNYAIINESFAFGSGKSYERLSHLDATKSSVRFVLGQFSENIRKLIGEKNGQIEKMLHELYSETMRAITKLNR